jgi:hypothetical protein
MVAPGGSARSAPSGTGRIASLNHRLIAASASGAHCGVDRGNTDQDNTQLGSASELRMHSNAGLSSLVDQRTRPISLRMYGVSTARTKPAVIVVTAT